MSTSANTDGSTEETQQSQRGRRFRLVVRLSFLALLVLLPSVGVMFMVWMPGSSWEGPLPPLQEEGRARAGVLRAHVEMLATEIGPRNMVERPSSMKRAAAYLHNTLEGQGLRVQKQSFTVVNTTVYNLEVIFPGTSRADETVILGAHYDTHEGSPGADDNASGVAALLEIARLLKGKKHARTIRLVFFANEELPFARTPLMGSVVYARNARLEGMDITAMISLETLGNYSDEPGSQVNQWPFNYFYPDTGNFLAFISDLGSRDLMRQSLSIFRDRASFPSEGVAAPGWLAGTYRSDHWAFWIEGYPGFMVSDTAEFRGGRYHTAEDTPEHLDYEGLSRVTAGLAEVALGLANEEE